MSRSNDNHQTEDFRPDGLVQRLFRGPSSGAYRLVVWAFVLGSASHLWLLDAWQLDWVPANLVYLLGLVVLVVSGGSAGWWLCAVGLAIPLLFLRDQLTQSMFMLAISVAGGAFVYLGARGVGATMRVRVRQFLWTCRWLTVATYAFAAFHKLNRDFFDPEVGCASYGLRKLAEYYRLEPTFFSLLDPFHAPLAVGLELAIPLAYIVGRRHTGRTLAVIFHIPLTMTMAPAFAFVMAAGHAAWVTNEERAELWRVSRERATLIVPVALCLTAASLVAHGPLPEVTMIPREFLLWMLLLWFVVAACDREFREALTSRLPTTPRSTFGVVVVLAFAVNCVTPYLGLQYQHAAAMLSNLRIDRGCWNHYVVPETIRLTDDYVRVEEAWFGEPGRVPDYEEIVLEQLWSPPQIRQMRRNWCRPELRPFHMQGTFRGRKWIVEDLCDEDEPWPFPDAGILGIELFQDYLRFQKNLMRDCPQACIH